MEQAVLKRDARIRELQLHLTSERKLRDGVVDVKNQLLHRFYGIQCSASWQLTRPLRFSEHRWPGFVRGVAAAVELTRWVVTLRLPERLRLRRQMNELLASELNPLHHYLLRGQHEGRLSHPQENLIRLPLEKDNIQDLHDKAIAMIAHILFPDRSHDILRVLKNIPFPYSLYISTDTEDKQRQIRAQFTGSNLAAKKIDVRVTPNRGRNLGQLLFEFGAEALKHDFVCHLRGKKSSSTSYGSSWRQQLFYGLLGSEEIVHSILPVLCFGSAPTLFEIFFARGFHGKIFHQSRLRGTAPWRMR